MNMKASAIIQVRQTSSRLPGKALIDICGKPALQRVIERVRAAKTLNDVIVACTTNSADDAIISLCEKLGCNYFRGSEEDVLDRVLNAARQYDIDVICEITADCLLIDYNHIDTLVNMHLNSDCDMTSNIISRTFPRGYDVRVFNTEALERAEKEIDNDIDRQHVSTWMYLNPKGKLNYKVQNWDSPCEQFRPDIEVTLDTAEDLQLIRWIYSFESGYNMTNGLSCQEVINLINTHPAEYAKVSKIVRKDYFQEIEEWYKQNNKGAKKHEQVQCADNRIRKPGSVSGRTKKRK
jgi:spore coat polysaccharide biosynthesis protein SpsF